MRILIILCLGSIAQGCSAGFMYLQPKDYNSGQRNKVVNKMGGYLRSLSTIQQQDFRRGLDYGTDFSSTSSFSPSSSSSSSLFNSNNMNRVEPIVAKHFYFHSAPEEPEDRMPKRIVLGTPRINYRVIFIKAPSSGAKANRITIVPPQNEDKTVIYVLSKKTEISDIQTDIQPVAIKPTKPEVFFIKYKTPEEAVYAQKQIQAQYDVLGGTSHVSDEGIAPITSVGGIQEMIRPLGGSYRSSSAGLEEESVSNIYRGSKSFGSSQFAPGYLPSQ